MDVFQGQNILSFIKELPNDEFCFRINRSQYKESIFHKTILRMVLQKPKYQKNIKQTLGV